MGIRHVVTFKFNEGVSEETIAEIGAKLAELPGHIAAIQDYSFGADLGLADGNYDYAVVADFETEDDWIEYRDNPVHRALIADLIAPNIADRCAVQIHS